MIRPDSKTIELGQEHLVSAVQSYLRALSIIHDDEIVSTIFHENGASEDFLVSIEKEIR